MTIAEYIKCAIDAYEQDKLQSALLHACAAVDGTASKLFPNVKDNRARFVNTIERCLWVVEPMLGLGINLETTEFSWIVLNKQPPQFSQIVYEIFRCNLAHGTEIPLGFSLELRKSDQWRCCKLGPQKMVLPDTLIFSLMSIAVFSSVNIGQHLGGTYHLSHADKEFVIDEWWGREADARAYFNTVKMPRVTMQW